MSSVIREPFSEAFQSRVVAAYKSESEIDVKQYFYDAASFFMR
jgi:hypothetical protein